jgi:hypothetical protein
MFCQNKKYCEKPVFIKGADDQFSRLFSNGIGEGMIIILF